MVIEPQYSECGVLFVSDNNTEWLTVEDVYERLGRRVPIDTIRSWIRTGRLLAYKPGRAYLVKKEDLDKFIQDSRTRPDDRP